MTRREKHLSPRKRIAYRCASVLLLVVLWQVVAWAVHKDFLVPGPIDVGVRLGQLCVTLSFWQHVGATLGRVLVGFLLGFAIGTLLGVCMHVSNAAYHLLSPVIKLIMTIPLVAFVLILLLWVDRNWLPVVVACLMVIPVTWSHIYTALESLDVRLVEMTHVFRLTGFERLRHFFVPACMPAVLAAVNTGIGLAWKSGVTAEVLALPALAIGHKLYDGKIYLESADIFAWTVVVVALCALSEWIVKKAFTSTTVSSMATTPDSAIFEGSDDSKEAIGATTEELIAAVRAVPAAAKGMSAATARVVQKPAFITLDRVTKAFGDKTVLSKLSLDLPEQGCVCFFGPSGCGKSTLLRLVARLDEPSSGSVRINTDRSIWFSYVFEDDLLLPWKNALQNVAMVVKGNQARAKEALEAVGLSGEYDTPIQDLSGGMRRRVAIARALAFDGDVLILDEPSLRLDRALALRVMDTLCKQWSSRLILLVTHDAELCTRYAQEIIPCTSDSLPASGQRHGSGAIGKNVVSRSRAFLQSVGKESAF